MRRVFGELKTRGVCAQADENQGFVRLNYAYCVENPSAPTCPGSYNVNPQRHAQGHMIRHRHTALHSY